MGIYSDADIEDVTTHAKGKAAPLDPTIPHPAVDPEFDVRTDAYAKAASGDLDEAKTVESPGLFDHSGPRGSNPPTGASGGALRIEPTITASAVPNAQPTRDAGITPLGASQAGATPIPSDGSRVVDVPQAYSALSHLDVRQDLQSEPSATHRTIAEKLILGAVGALLVASVLVLVVALLVF